VTFIVRVQESGTGELAGTVERLRTREKQAFRGTESLARLIEEAVRAAREPEEREKWRATTEGLAG
jgi:hypothetical protein